VPRLCEVYPGICLTTEEKARKNLSQGSRRMPVGIFLRGLFRHFLKLLGKCPATYGTRTFISVFIQARLSHPVSSQAFQEVVPPHPPDITKSLYVQGGSNMTGTDLCVNKPHKSRSYLNRLVFLFFHMHSTCLSSSLMGTF
jgi:hypothetical protein